MFVLCTKPLSWDKTGISFRNQNYNDGQGNMAGTCQLRSGEFPAKIDR